MEKSKGLSDYIIQAIKNKEANAATDMSAKDEHMIGAWIIEDEHKIARSQSEV